MAKTNTAPRKRKRAEAEAEPKLASPDAACDGGAGESKDHCGDELEEAIHEEKQAHTCSSTCRQLRHRIVAEVMWTFTDAAAVTRVRKARAELPYPYIFKYVSSAVSTTTATLANVCLPNTSNYTVLCLLVIVAVSVTDCVQQSLCRQHCGVR